MSTVYCPLSALFPEKSESPTPYQLSVLNLLKYNVAGGGDSSLYGVEDSLFYLRSGFLAFNTAFFAAIASAPAELVASFVSGRRPRTDLLAITGSFLLWVAFMTVIPHKEERFLYVVYPQARVPPSHALWSYQSAPLPHSDGGDWVPV